MHLAEDLDRRGRETDLGDRAPELGAGDERLVGREVGAGVVDGDAVVVGEGDVEVEPAGWEQVHHLAVAVHEGIGVTVEVVGAEDHLPHLSCGVGASRWREIATRARETGNSAKMEVVGTPALVGREEQLRPLTRVLDETLAGIGRLVLISGEPGVGKTRLALEILDEAGPRGARSAVGACWDGAGAPGLWPWVQILRSLRSELGAAGWEQAAGSGHGALTRLLDIDERATAVEFHLFEATLQFLANVCGERPLVVLLDDLQWSDPASVALVEFLHHHAVHLPLLMVGTYRADEVARPEHPLREPVADLALKAVTIPLKGLDNDAIRQVREQLGAPTSTAEAEHLRRLTGGNPFFVIESVAFTDPTESLGVRRAIDRRVDALGDVERHLLTVASLIGRDVPDALLDAVVGESADAALAAIERSGLMRRNQGQHTFVHDLVRETMRDRLPPNERRGLYAAIVMSPIERACVPVSCLRNWHGWRLRPCPRSRRSEPWRCWRRPRPTPPPASITRRPDDTLHRRPS